MKCVFTLGTLALCLLWPFSLARAELDTVSRGASDVHYLRADAQESRENLRAKEALLAECQRNLKREKSRMLAQKAAFKTTKSNACDDNCRAQGVAPVSYGCSGKDFESLGIRSLPVDVAACPVLWSRVRSMTTVPELSAECNNSLNFAYSCVSEERAPPPSTELDWEAQCDDYEQVVEDAKTEYDEAKEEVADARRACPNCELIEKMKPREPGVFDFVLAGIQAAAPVVAQGLALNAQTSIVKIQADAYAGTIGNYINYCRETGQPCPTPWGTNTWAGAPGIYGVPMAAAGGVGGGLFGNPFTPSFGMGGGAFAVPLSSGYAGGNFMNGGGANPFGMPYGGAPGFANPITQGYGVPMQNFGTGFNSALFPNGAMPGTGYFGGLGSAFGGGGQGNPFGMPGGVMPSWGGSPMGMGGFPYSGLGYGNMGMGYGGNPFTPGLGMGFNMNLNMGMGAGFYY